MRSTTSRTPESKQTKPVSRNKAVAKPTRKSLLVKALSKTKPVTIARLTETLSLQPHSVRAAISGLRKEGHAVETIKSRSGGATTYQIVDKPAQAVKQGNTS